MTRGAKGCKDPEPQAGEQEPEQDILLSCSSCGAHRLWKDRGGQELLRSKNADVIQISLFGHGLFGGLCVGKIVPPDGKALPKAGRQLKRPGAPAPGKRWAPWSF